MLATESITYFNIGELLKKDWTSDEVLVIPWEGGVVTSVKRKKNFAGCQKCLLRRLLATTYHKKNGIPSVDTVTFNDPEYLENSKCFAESQGEHSTLTYFFHQSLTKPIPFHVIPAPGCQCQDKDPPEITKELANFWLQRWPNVIVNYHSYENEICHYHLKSASLANTSLIFGIPFQAKYITASIAQAAGFRDNFHLEQRLTGEAMERYSGTYIPKNSLFLDRNLSTPFTPTKNQFAPNLWTEGKDLFNKAQPVQAQLMYSLLHYYSPSQYSPLSSSGMAAHTNLNQAILSACLEAVERESLIVSWRATSEQGSPLLSRVCDSLLEKNPAYNWTKYLINRIGGDLKIFNITNLLNIPQILAIFIPSDEGPPLFGSGINVSVKEAIEKALSEMLQGLTAPRRKTKIVEPVHFRERPLYWAEEAKMKVLSLRLSARGASALIPRVHQELTIEYIRNSFLEMGVEIIYKEITPPDIQLGGWHVVRVHVPIFEPFVGSSKFEKPSLKRVNNYLKICNLDPVNSIIQDPYPFP